MLISVSRRGEQGGADTSTHQDSEKPDHEIAQWFNATETCAPHAYRVLMSKPDFAAPLAPRNLAIFDDALEAVGHIFFYFSPLESSWEAPDHPFLSPEREAHGREGC